MKKTFKFLVVSLLAVSLLVACGGGGDNKGDGEGSEKADFKVVVVLDSGGVDDKSFNQSSWEGVQKFLKDNNLDSSTATYLSSKDESEYVPNLETASKEGDLVIAVGFLFAEAMAEVAAKHPDIEYLFIDAGLEEPLPNVHSATFSEEEGGFLVGLIAGKKSKEDGSNKVGFIGGVDNNPVINAFHAGYEKGVWEANPDATISIEYADSFEDTSKGSSLATKLYNDGSNIIFHAAGNVGNGVISEAKNHQDKWVIGVDRDQYEDGLDGDRSVILTSMIKRVDLAAYNFLAEYLEKGKIESEHFHFNVENSGVDAELTPDRNLTKEDIEYVESYYEKVKAGEMNLTKVPVIKNGQSGTKPE